MNRPRVQTTTNARRREPITSDEIARSPVLRRKSDGVEGRAVLMSDPFNIQTSHGGLQGWSGDLVFLALDGSGAWVVRPEHAPNYEEVA